jgi:tetratricopeptide (TPR) repeat protein
MQHRAIPRFRALVQRLSGIRYVASTRACSVAFSAALLLGGCGANPGARPLMPEATTVASASVSDDAFAEAFVDLLLTDPETPERAVRLVGVTQRQFSRAVRRFRGRSPEMGVATLSSALYTLRAGEFRDQLLGPDGVGAFRLAARELSSRGDEGRARATYEVLLRAGTPADRAAAQEHLTALARWNSDLAQGASPVVAASRAATVGVARHLFETSGASLDDATAAIGKWVTTSAELRTEFRRSRAQPPREDGIEAIRAFSVGPPMLVAMYVHSGKLKAARDIFDRTGMRQLLRRDLSTALDQVAVEPTAEHWLALGTALTPGSTASGAAATAESDEDVLEDLDVLRIAAGTCAFEAYRLDVLNPVAVVHAAKVVTALGLIEVAPQLFDASFTAATRSAPVSPARLAVELTLLQRGLAATSAAMQAAVANDDLSAARRTYRAASRMRAAGALRRGELGALLTELDVTMGLVDLSDGELLSARALLVGAQPAAGQVRVQIALAQIARHDGDLSSAQRRLAQVVANPTKNEGEPAELAVAALELADIRGLQGNLVGTGQALELAYDIARNAADQAQPASRVAGNLALADVLERVNRTRESRMALDAALDAARREPRLIEECARQMAVRAFRSGDLAGSREAFKRALALELPPASLAYFALWHALLSRDAKVAIEPAAQRVLEQALEAPEWHGHLAAFALGRVTESQLIGFARNGAERTEAHFYVARLNSALLAGAALTPRASTALRAAVTAGGIRQIEYAIARDLVTPPKVLTGALARRP